jgi:hypothetical protein
MRVQQSIITLGLLQARLTTAQFAYADNKALPIEKDSESVARNFPDVDIELIQPSFTDPDTIPDGWTNGTSGPTDQSTMEQFLQTLAARNDWMTYHNPTFQSEEGRSLPYVFLSTSNMPATTESMLKSHCNSTEGHKLRIWMQGGVHGNEPAGDGALLALLGKLDANATWAASVLEHADILMLPRYNPDGVAYFQRYLATSFDPNRDHTKLARQQTRDIKKLVMDFSPHVGVDMHEYTANRGYGKDGQYLPAQDGQFSATKNLNIHADIRELAETLFADNIAAAMERYGLRWSGYVTGNSGTDDIILEESSADAKIGDTAVGLNQAVMFLTETRGIRLADQHWQRRVASGLVMVETILQVAVDNAKLVYNTVEAARKDYIENVDEIVITDKAFETQIEWEFIDGRNGSLVQVPVTFFNTTPLDAVLTRKRPDAYVFSKAWHDVAERLRVMGVVVDELRSDFTGEVEAFNITSAELATSKYESIVRTTVETESFQKEITIPAGGYWVNTRQKNIALAYVVLEPENIDSFATFNILPVGEGDEYQVYRVHK